MMKQKFTPNRIKKLLCTVLIAAVFSLPLVSCSESSDIQSGNISIVTTIFPAYDFAREIAGSNADIKMLLKPGAEAHSYEPTPQDIIAVQNCDVFVYTGGESDEWVKEILKSMDMSGTEVIAMMDCVDAVEEEISEGMQVREEEHDVYHEEKDDESEKAKRTDPENNDNYEIEYDEHVWTSPMNAIRIVEAISGAVTEANPANAQSYTERTADYVSKLRQLDGEFRDIVNSGKRRTIVFGDRFPCRYFADEYGLKYYAAFPGCSAETEASAQTLSFLIDKVREENIPVVLYPELSNKKVAITICESTGAESMQFNSCHNVTREEFEGGASYLSLMNDNKETLIKALN